MMQEALAAAAAQYQSTGEGDLYPPGAHAIGHGAEHVEGGEGAEGDASHMAKRTADWVQEGEEEQDEAKKARLDGEPGNADDDIQSYAQLMNRLEAILMLVSTCLWFITVH